MNIKASNPLWKYSTVFLVIVVFFFLTAVTVSYTTKTEFCISCHSMNSPSKEYKKSQHFTSPSGVRAGCSDCHIGKGARRIMAVKLLANDFWKEISNPIKDEQDWEKRRHRLADSVREMLVKNKSATCRGCHNNHSMVSQSIRKTAAHSRIDTEGKTCIECHYNIVHDEVLWKREAASR